MRGKVLVLTAFLALFIIVPMALVVPISTVPSAHAQDACPDSTNPLCPEYTGGAYTGGSSSAPTYDEQWNSDGTITSGGFVVGSYDPTSGGGANYFSGGGTANPVDVAPTAPDQTYANPCANGDAYDPTTGGCVSSTMSKVNGTNCPTGQTPYYDPSTGMTSCRSNTDIATQVGGTKCPTGQTAYFNATTGQTACQGSGVTGSSGAAKEPTAAPGSGNIANLVCSGGLGNLISLVASACKAYAKVASYIPSAKQQVAAKTSAGGGGSGGAGTGGLTSLPDGSGNGGTLNSATKIPTAKDIIDALPGANVSTNTSDILTVILNYFFEIIGIAAFASVLYSGFMYVTAGGDEQKTTTARRNLVWALTGIILAIASLTILNFVASIGK